MDMPRQDALGVPGQVVLAHEPAFRLGSLEVEPARRQVRSGAAAETVEPRVMQVLVALVRAHGDIVTRDELTELCWGGRIVGDDSINRVLAKIRRIASGIGEASFAVETIPRVGYRLDAAAFDGPSAALKAVPHAANHILGRRPLLIGLGAVAAAGAVGADWWVGTQRP